jgi:hypothetical protein
LKPYVYLGNDLLRCNSIVQGSPDSTNSSDSDNSSANINPQRLFETEDVASVTNSSIDEVNEEEDINGTNHEIICANCFRRNNQTFINDYGGDLYKISFSRVRKDKIRRRRSFRNIRSSCFSDEVIDLCEQCSNYLVKVEVDENIDLDTRKKNEKIAKSQINTWPAFIWSLLNNRNILRNYGAQIWCFIPVQWRYWWIDSLKENVNIVYDNITITSPKSIFIDRSNAIKEWDDDISSFMLSRLASSCNKHILPNILCPWGCTEFNHRCGYIGMDLIFQRFLPKSIIELMNESKNMINVISARDDYIRFDDDYDKWLLNPDWEVRPSISFVPGKGPVVLTCRDHMNGTKKLMIHPPRQPSHILPSSQPDQLCHAVVKPRIIRPMKSCAYSNSYQMHEQRGTFNGIDTCSVASYGRFDFCSKLLNDSECRSIKNRPDINALLSTLCKDKVISVKIAASMRKYASSTCRDIDFESCVQGSTYVPVMAAITLQRELQTKEITMIWDDRVGVDGNNNPLPNQISICKKIWPSVLYPLQKNNSYGAYIPCVPYCKSNDKSTSMLWVVGTLLTRVEILWQAIIDMNGGLHQSKWHGWMLTWLTKQCFMNHSNRMTAKNDPFKYSCIKTYQDMAKKVGDQLSNDLELETIFENVNNFLSVDDFGDVEDAINVNQHGVIVISNYKHNEESNIDSLPETLVFNNVKYELRVFMKLTDMNDDDNNWSSESYSRHGSHFSSWWRQSNKHNKLCTHANDLPDLVEEDDNVRIIVAYVKLEKIDFTTLNYEYLQYIGGQSHIFCNEHNLPLIISAERTKKCNCGRKEHFSCPNLDCLSCICKHCADDKDRTTIFQVAMNEDALNDDNDNVHAEDELIEPTVEQDYFNHDGDDILNGENNQNDEIDMNELDETERDRLFNINIDNSEDAAMEKENFDDFVTSNEAPDTDSNEFEYDSIPTTNAGEYAYEIEEEVPNDRVHVSGHVVLNQNGTVLTRKKHQISGSSLHKFFLQKICSTSVGTSIPILYPESMLFPSIFYHMSEDGAMSGAIPSPLLTENINQFGFESVPQHIRSRLTSCSFSSGTDPRYIAFSYDIMTNLAVNHEDTRIALHRGLTVDEDSESGLGVRGKSTGDSAILESIDSKQMVKNLSSAEKFIDKFDFFITLTCNMKKHFGTKVVKNWIDSDGWKQHFEGYTNLTENEKEEIHTALIQASGCLLLRIWEEISKLFLEYLKKSKSSPYKNVFAIFARKEYQKDRGNLSHTHLMLKLAWSKLSEEEKNFIDDLIRASVCDVVRVDEVDHMVEHGLLNSVVDLDEVVKDASTVLGHRCSLACLVMVSPGVYKCKKLNNLKVSHDNNKHTFKALPNQYSLECLDRLVQIGLVDQIVVTKDGYEAPFKSSLEYFHPKRHIPPTNPNGDINMSPVDGYLFTACRSMQNVQFLTHCGGVNKYVVKYIGKIDEQNYVIICTDGSKIGKLVSKAFFLHNTKVSTSKFNEDKVKDQNRNKNHVQGRAISQNEMVHVMLRYPEVSTDLNFISIPTIPLELRAGVDKGSMFSVQDGVDAGIVSDIVRCSVIDEEWRQHTDSEKLILEDLKLSTMSVDKISQFSIRPPELRYLFDQVGNYYRWFKIISKEVNEDKLRNIITNNIRSSSWVDGLQRVVKIRVKAIPEVIDYINNKMNHHNREAPHIKMMVDLFNDISSHIENNQDNEEISEENQVFGNQIKSAWIDNDEQNEHLPIPVYSYIKPTMGTQFILHLLLSMGHFNTEIDLTLKENLRESFRCANLIGPLNDDDSLQQYSNELLKKFIKEQLQYFPNSKRVIDSWIIVAGELLDEVLVHNSIPINNMPAVQQSTLFASTEEECVKYIESTKVNVIKSAMSELKEESIQRCSIPSIESIVAAKKESPITWNAYESFRQNNSQPDSSFVEQQFAVKNCIKTIESYRNGMFHNSFTKSIGIRGYAGCGKSFIMQYVLLYAMSQGLLCIPTAMMSRRSVFLGGKHIHILFGIPAERNLSPHRMAEIAITKLLRDPKKLNLLRVLDCLFLDEIGQLSSELLAVLDIIFRRVKDTNIFLGGVIIIGTIDHTQLQPVQGRPFLTSSHVISCFKMTMLSTSVRASNDPNFQRIQEIARMHYQKYTENPSLLDEFKDLLSATCTFVPNWSSTEITPSTYRLYSKKFPAKEATRQFVSAVTQSIEQMNLRKKNADDVQKSRYSHGEWGQATDDTKCILDQKLKEPRTLLFFRGAVYEFTYNNDEKYSQGQMALLFDLPSQDIIDRNKKIKILAAPPGLQDVDEFDHTVPKEFYLSKGFNEVTIGIAPERTQDVGGNTQAQRKQYGLKHRVTSTIHAAMGDTLSRVAIEISRDNNSFKLWDCAQAIVTLSRTKLGKNLIFVGDKTETIAALTELIQMKSQWTDYMEEVLRMITLRNENETQNNEEENDDNHQLQQLSQRHYPFRICDVVLPQCNTGFVYMLSSIKRPTYSYIGETNCLRDRLKQHNSGYGSLSTEPSYLRPFAVMAFICGFNGEKNLRRFIEQKWKEKRDSLAQNGINDIRRWAHCGNEVIENLDETAFNTEKSELRLILLFRS